MTAAAREATAWPDSSDDDPPAGHLYRSAVWLLGRHDRLDRLASRIAGVMYVDDADDELSIDLDHLGEVFAAVPQYQRAWQEYESRQAPPQEDAAFERWCQAGPRADDLARGLSDLLVMSSGEIASLRLLATLGSELVPFKIPDLQSLDAEGQRLLGDWCRAIQAW